MLSNHIRIAQRFQRSIRIDSDSGDQQLLKGFICPSSSAEVLLTMARHATEAAQGAFTWTGPFGSGKSSLALAFSALLSTPERQRQCPQNVLGAGLSNKLQTAFPPKSKGWTFLPVIGRRAPLREILGEALNDKGLVKSEPRTWTDDHVLKLIQEAARANPANSGGLLIIVDELGKVLEGAAHDEHDILLLQNIAEVASRSKGRLLFIGILHQSFDEYAQRLAREMRDEWAKIQGRFVDLAVNVAGDEQLELLSRAIERDKPFPAAKPVAQAVATVIQCGRPGASKGLAATLARCWPLHPVAGALLGPLSRRRFGQNQRSLFAFLNSAEPFGFQDFLTNSMGSAVYTPDLLWDYLKANLESAILASSDGHRWSTAVEAIDRCSLSGCSELHLALLKTIALVDLFRERSGLRLTRELLLACAPQKYSKSQIEEALQYLTAGSFIVFRKHLGAYALYAGSDFDIDQAVSAALPDANSVDLKKLRTIAGLQPILAKRHYHETGAIRWFNLDIVPVSKLQEILAASVRLDGAAGRLLLAIPTNGETQRQAEEICSHLSRSAPPNSVIGLSPSAWLIIDFARDLVALTEIHDQRPELRGDAVARREVSARLADLRNRLEQELGRLIERAVWYCSSRKPEHLGIAGLNHLISDLADERFAEAPRLFNELVNRDDPSSNAVKAQKDLMRRMIDGEGKPRLGLQGYPAEAGLCESILLPAGLYRQDDHGRWQFAIPAAPDDPARVAPLFSTALAKLRAERNAALPLSHIFDLWREPPYGVKFGLMPIFAVALYLAHRNELAIYRQGVFQPHITELDIELLASDPAQIQFRYMAIEGAAEQVLHGLATLALGQDESRDKKPLDVARALIATYDALPPYTRRSIRLSPTTQKVSVLLRHAADPNKLLFDDLSALVKARKSDEIKIDTVIKEVAAALDELKQFYPRTLRSIEDTLLRELEVDDRTPAALEGLRTRAKYMTGISGDLRINAFITRLSEYAGTNLDIEGLISFALNKRPIDWVDADVDQARLELAQLAQRFIRDEAFARVSNRPDKRMRMAVVVPLQGHPTAMQSEFDVTDHDRKDIAALISSVEAALKKADPKRQNVILAALAELSARYMIPAHRETAARRNGALR